MLFFLPFSYALVTRAKGLFHKCSFIIIIVFPILYISYVNGYMNTEWFFINFFLAFTALYSVYEIGYIYNDVITTKFERNPTNRLNEKDQLKVERLMNLLISFRLVYASICILFLNYTNVLNLGLFVICLVLLHLSYAFHNYFRDRKNILTIFFVLLLKYISVPLLFIQYENLFSYITIAILIVPILRTIEFSAKPKYKISLFSKFEFDNFRVIYYFILIIIGLIISTVDERFVHLIVLASILFTFRLIVLIALKSENIADKVRKSRKI